MFVQDFTRRIRLKEYFKDNENQNFDPRFHVPSRSNWQPPPSKDPNIEKGLRLLKANTFKLKYAPVNTSGLNSILPKPVMTFINNPDIVIKQADKNLGLTVIDKSWYINEGLTQLSNTSYYECTLEQIDVNIVQELVGNLSHEATKLLGLMQGLSPSLFTKQHFKFLEHSIEVNRNIPTFHLIPKIHKTPMAGRPIVPSHSWLTTGFSVWLDTILQKVLPHRSYIIKDTTSLIHRLEGLSLPSNTPTWFITGDVSSMYTNIPTNEKTFDMICTYIGEQLDLNSQDQSILIRVLSFIMMNNFFTFNNKLYRQINGVAMGTSCAPALANIFMYITELNYFENMLESGLPFPVFYGRYIDDIICIYAGSKYYVDNFVADFDSFRLYSDELKINWTISATSVEFLDLVISNNNSGKIHLAPHQKLLNKYLYVPFCSYHPKDSKTGFIKAELIRYVRNSSSEHEFTIIAKRFFYRLRLRGYPPRYLIWVFSQVSYSQRSHYLTSASTTSDTNLVPFVTQYNPVWEIPKFRTGLNIFRDHSTKYRTTVAFRRNRNLMDIINTSNSKKLRCKSVRTRLGSDIRSCVIKKRRYL
ncbi:hypothetical protein G6F43_012029 [Rhizopus delemar]|nr:hypothetical protein G6F43_012029 [Rhizopus delemar]